MTDDAHAADSHGSPAPVEPRTPMWLPALGAVLFLLVAIWCATSSAKAPAPAADGEAAAGSAAPATADGGAQGAPAAKAAQ